MAITANATHQPLLYADISLTEAIATELCVGYDGAKPSTGEPVMGVLTEGYTSGSEARVCIVGIVRVTAGGTITVGNELVSAGAGKVKAATNLSVTIPTDTTPVTSDAAQPTLVVGGGALPEKICGVALSAGNDGDTILMKLTC